MGVSQVRLRLATSRLPFLQCSASCREQAGLLSRKWTMSPTAL